MKLCLNHSAPMDLLIAFRILRENGIINELDDAEAFFEKPWKYTEDIKSLQWDDETIEVKE